MSQDPMEEKVHKVPIEWRIPDSLPILWSNNMFIQHTEEEFIITFFQTPPPLLVEPTPEDIYRLEKVTATAVARISISPAHMERFIQAMITNFNTYQQKVALKKGGI